MLYIDCHLVVHRAVAWQELIMFPHTKKHTTFSRGARGPIFQTLIRGETPKFGAGWAQICHTLVGKSKTHGNGEMFECASV